MLTLNVTSFIFKCFEMNVCHNFLKMITQLSIETMVLNTKINLLVYMLYSSERSCSLSIRYISRMFEISRLRKISSSPASLS